MAKCPACFRGWPRSADHDLRGFGWLDPLPRNISVSNADLLVHDGYHGADRFLFFEVKMPWEKALQAGQNWLLRSLAGQAGWTVRLVHGRPGGVALHRVSRDGVDANGLVVPLAGVRARVVDWINGNAWEDPAPTAREKAHDGTGAHLCGWSRLRAGVYACVQDFYAEGNRPQTGCGATWTYHADEEEAVA